ncbi:MAG: hypothetical protein H0T42_18465, partial [Deltaproteobacteria bacterium]|nr:hypothetical protein [Deltaproteobacteria bacterium]
ADLMSWEAKGDCIDVAGGMVTGDPGSFSVPANTLMKRMGTGIADTCMVTIEVRRTRVGVLDPGYGKGGRMVGVQSRTIMVTSNP